MTPSPEMNAAPDSGEGLSTSALLDSVFSEFDGGGEQGNADPAAPAEGKEAPPQDGQQDEFSLDRIMDEDEGEPEKIDENGRNAYKMSEQRFQKYQAALKLADGISEFAPSVEAARQHYQRASDFNTLESDFQNPHEIVEDGNGQQVPAARAWLDHWAEVSPEGISAVAQMLPRYLAEKGNHAALNAVHQTVLGAEINGLYNKAAQTGDPEDLARAQNADYAMTGKFRDKVAPVQQRGPQDELSARARQIEQREQNLITGQWKAFDAQALSGPKEAALNGQLDAIFNKPELQQSFGPNTLKAIRNQVASELQNSLKGNIEWQRNHDIGLRTIQTEFTKAFRNNQQTNLTPQAKSLVDDYAAQVRRHIFALARPLLQEATQKAVNGNRATHQKLAAGAGTSVPSGAGSPTRRSVAAQVPQFKSREEAMEYAYSNQ